MVLWVLNKRIVLWEWLIGVVVSLLTALVFQYLSVAGMTRDIETWSGQVVEPKQYSRWKEYYEYAVYRTETIHQTCTDSEGKSYDCSYTIQVFDHWEPTSRWHNEHWNVDTTLGSYSISSEKYQYLCKKFGEVKPVRGNRTTSEHNSRMIAGDPNDYIAVNKNHWIEPVSKTVSFENRVKAAPSLFSFGIVPTNISVFSWPETKDLFTTDRLLGTARQKISVLEWDQLNAVLGTAHKINLIMVGFPSGTPSDYGKWQEAKWIGGKKNDLVICFAAGENVEWVYVFGWTEKAIIKKNLESLLFDHPINSSIIPKIKDEVVLNYQIKDWKKFDYITIEPPTWSYWVFAIVLTVTQILLYIFFHKNDMDKNNSGYQIPIKRWGKLKL